MFTWKSKVLFHIAATVIILLFMMIGNVSYSTAQQAFFWSPQERIPEYYLLAQQPPYLIADQNRTVHAFNSQPIHLEDKNSPKAVFYRQWTQEGSWTYPIDIVYDSMGGSIEILNVTSNSIGLVYLIYQRDFQDVYFTKAYLVDAGSSKTWSTPILIARQSTHVGVGFEGIGAIATDRNGTIVVTYSGSESGNGLYSTYSSDYGDTWSPPYPVYLAENASWVVTDPQLFIGESGIIHGVWSTFENDGSGGPGYYANFYPETQIWSDPKELDIPGIRTPSVIEYGSDVFVSYYHINTNGNWWRRSSDDGATWTDPSQISPSHFGTNGRVSFVIDSNNTLHGFFGERINDFNHGLWHIIWLGSSWTAPDAIVRGPQIRDVPGGDGFDPGAARAVVSNGNLILVTWTTDGFAGENGAWYSYKTLNAPALPSLPNLEPTLAITGLQTNTPVELLTVESTNTPITLLEGNDRQPSSRLFNPQTSIFSGVILALILVIGIFILRILAQSRNVK